LTAEDDFLERAAAGAEACKALADEVSRQAEALLGLADRLEQKSIRLGLIGSGLLAGPDRADRNGGGDAPAGPAAERPPVGRRGAVTVDQALEAAKALTAAHEDGFRRADLIEATGLSPAQSNRMLETLTASGSVERVLEEGAPTSRFRYVPIAQKPPASRPRSAGQVDAASGVGADAPVRGRQAAHTRWKGRSDSSVTNKRRSQKGVKVKARNKK